MLACFASGSMLAGIGYGAVQWRSPSVQRFRLGVVLLAVGVVPVALVQQIWLLAVVGFVAGFTISPMLISGNAVVQDLVAPARLTEGLTFIATALGLGVPVVEINPEPTGFSAQADHSVQLASGTALPLMLSAARRSPGRA